MDYLAGGYGSGLAGLAPGYGNGYAGLGLGYGNSLAGLVPGSGDITESLIAGGMLWNGGYGLTGLSVPYQNFTAALQRALGGRQSLRQGKDVIMSFPAAGTAGKKTEDGRKSSEMTEEEYRDYICDRISSLSGSEDVRWNARGLLVLKDEAFARMQKDPSYEKKVLEILQKDIQERKSADVSSPAYRVIGGSEAESYTVGAMSKGALASSYEKEKSRQSEHAWRLAAGTERREDLAERLIKNRNARTAERAAQRYAEGRGTASHL